MLTFTPSLPRRTLPLRRTLPRHCDLSVFRAWGWFLRDVCEPHRVEQRWVEVFDSLLLLASIRDRFRLVHVPRDCRTDFGGVGIQ